MGTDKANVEFLGRPLIAHAIGILQEANLPVLIAGNRPDLQNYAQTVNDLGPLQGPLGGICGALTVTSVTTTVFVPVDLPLLPSGLISLMRKIAYVTGCAVVVPSVNGYVQTFPAVLNRATLPILKRELEAGCGGCFSAFAVAAKAMGQQVHVIRTELLAQGGQLRHPDGLPVARWFFNINSSADLQQAQAFRKADLPSGDETARGRFFA
jgi:molybdopterin-guanine dinucleotide biosynthesis protein A